MTGDPARGLRFGTVAELYDDFRPRLPAQLRDHYGDLLGVEVLDLAAGTGILSRFLCDLGAVVTAVEPDDQMREVLQVRSPGIDVRSGTAEAIPLPEASVQIVTCSSAWHWFTQPQAAFEIARVLQDNGKLIVVWNGFDRSCEWLASLMALREPSTEHDAPPRHRVRTVELDRDVPFSDPVRDAISWTWTRSVEQVVSLFHTYSGVISRTSTEREELDTLIRGQLAPRASDGLVSVPMACGIFSCTRLPRPDRRVESEPGESH